MGRRVVERVNIFIIGSRARHAARHRRFSKHRCADQLDVLRVPGRGQSSRTNMDRDNGVRGDGVEDDTNDTNERLPSPTRDQQARAPPRTPTALINVASTPYTLLCARGIGHHGARCLCFGASRSGEPCRAVLWRDGTHNTHVAAMGVVAISRFLMAASCVTGRNGGRG